MNLEPKEVPNFEGEEMKLPTMRPGTAPHKTAAGISSGTIITLLFIVLALILAGITYWYVIGTGAPEAAPLSPTRPTLETNREPETVNATAETESFTVMSTSDELTAIEADLESTNLDTLESELVQIDQELEASFQ